MFACMYAGVHIGVYHGVVCVHVSVCLCVWSGVGWGGGGGVGSSCCLVTSLRLTKEEQFRTTFPRNQYNRPDVMM